MRRSRILVKPSLNPRQSRAPSVGSKEETTKEDGSQQKSAGEGTSCSAPAAVDTNSSTPSAPKLNFRRPAFSVRPKPTIRGLGVPNLHGTQPAPILVPPATKGKETVGSGDDAESVVKETITTEEPVVPVPVPLDVTEEPAIDAKSGDIEKHVPKDKDKSIPVIPNVETSASQEADTCVLPAAVGTDKVTPSETPKETADKGSLPEPNTEAVSKPSTGPQENSDKAKLLPKPEATTTATVKTIQPCTKTVSNDATKTQNTSDGVEAVKRQDEAHPDNNSASKDMQPVSIRRSRFSVQPKLDVKAPSKKPSTTSQPEDNGQTKTAEKEAEVTSKEAAAVSSDSSKNESDAVSIPRRGKFQVQPKLTVKDRVPQPRKLTSVDIQSDSPAALGVTNTQGVEGPNNEDQPDVPVKEKTAEAENIETSVKATPKSESTVLPRRNRFQIQPKPRIKTDQSASASTGENLPASQSVTTDDSASICNSTEADGGKEKEDSENQATNKDGEASSKEMASKVETTILPRRSRFQAQPKPRVKTAGQSSNAATTKPTVLDPPENETPSISTDDGDKQKSISENADVTTDKETISTVKEVPAVSRRMKFAVHPKLEGSQSKDAPASAPVEEKTSDETSKAPNEITSAVKEVPAVSRRMKFAVHPKLEGSQSKDAPASAPVEEKTSDETSKAPNEITSAVETSVLPRRNRFQIQPKPSAKTTKQSSSSSSSNELPTVKSPSLSENDTTLKSSEGTTTLETDDSLHKEETENQDAEATSKELPIRREQIPLPTLSRRSRFQVQPKVGASQSKDNQQGPSVNEENAKTSNENTGKSEAKILPRRNRFQIQPKPTAKTTVEQSVTNNDIPSTCIESVTSDSGTKQSNDTENKDGDNATKDATSKTEKTAAPTLSRRSRFQVRPKLGISKEPAKSPNEAREKGVERPPSRSTTPTVPNATKDAKRKKTDKPSTLPQTASTQDDLPNSESPNASEKSLTDSSVPTTPVKSSGKSSVSSSPLKDNIQIENIKQREYPVNVHKSGKGGKSLPLREKQKKPDISEHPSDKPPDRAKMKMRDLIYWNPSSSPMKSPDAKRARPIRQEEEPAPKAPEPTTNENEPIAVPQVKIGADGNIVLNEESLVINHSQPAVPISMEVVDETDVYSNYGSFRKYSPKSKWSLKETKKFFLALSTVGTDFTLMTNLFTKKTRRDLKNKFKREERNNRWLVDKAIKQQLHFDESLFEVISESEEEEPPPKKSRQKKDPSEKKKEPKPRKTKKTPNSDSTPPKKKTKKSKKITSKDWIIDSQDGEEDNIEEPENMVEGIVEEEPVQDEMLIIPENTPFSEDSLARIPSDAENQAKSMPTKVQKATVTPEDKSQEEEVVGILMEMGQRGFTLPPKPSSNLPSSAPESPRSKAPAPSMPMINTHSAAAATAVASKEPEVACRANTTPKLPVGVSVPGSSRAPAVGGAAVSATPVTPATEEARDSSSLARLFLQQMGLSSQMNALQDEIVSITEAEISHNDQKQKVILVEVQPKDQKQTVVHMYLVSRSDDAQSSADGSGGQVTVSEAQPLALPPSMNSLSDTPPSDVKIAIGTESNTSSAPATTPAPAPAPSTAPAPAPAPVPAPASDISKSTSS